MTGTPTPSPRRARAATLLAWFSAVMAAITLACGIALGQVQPISESMFPDDKHGVGLMLFLLPVLVGSLLLSTVLTLALGIPALVLSAHARRTPLIVFASGSLAVTCITVIVFVVSVALFFDRIRV